LVQTTFLLLTGLLGLPNSSPDLRDLKELMGPQR